MSTPPSELGHVTTAPEHASYALGHSPTEIRRLGMQATIVRPITSRLLQSLGISPGMRILDVGCGAGDVALLAADLVGASGEVVGIDRSESAILAARARAAAVKNVHFRVGVPDDALEAASFDVVVGRYVLVWQDDVAGFIRASARLVKPGGIVAFHELDGTHGFVLRPEVPLWSQANSWLLRAVRAMLPNFDVPGKLDECFSQAGLGTPIQFSDIPTADATTSPMATWLVETLRAVLPQIPLRDWAPEEVVAIDSLEERLRATASASHCQVSAPRQVCAWARVPP